MIYRTLHYRVIPEIAPYGVWQARIDQTGMDSGPVRETGNQGRK